MLSLKSIQPKSRRTAHLLAGALTLGLSCILLSSAALTLATQGSGPKWVALVEFARGCDAGEEGVCIAKIDPGSSADNIPSNVKSVIGLVIQKVKRKHKVVDCLAPITLEDEEAEFFEAWVIRKDADVNDYFQSLEYDSNTEHIDTIVGNAQIIIPTDTTRQALIGEIYDDIKNSANGWNRQADDALDGNIPVVDADGNPIVMGGTTITSGASPNNPLMPSVPGFGSFDDNFGGLSETVGERSLFWILVCCIPPAPEEKTHTLLCSP